jgi:hypothetical protein
VPGRRASRDPPIACATPPAPSRRAVTPSDHPRCPSLAQANRGFTKTPHGLKASPGCHGLERQWEAGEEWARTDNVQRTVVESLLIASFNGS